MTVLLLWNTYNDNIMKVSGVQNNTDHPQMKDSQELEAEEIRLGVLSL